MDKTLGKDIVNPVMREAFLKDNCDACEQRGYMKPFEPEELQGHKEKLANVSIEIAELEAELHQVQADFKGRLKPLKEQRSMMVSNIKSKAEYVNEICYRFTDQEERITGYYNKNGDLVEMRPATAEELQKTIFSATRIVQSEERTGTNN